MLYSILFIIAACISICIALFYFFLKLNSDDKPARRLDIIIDDYIYNGETKEKTIREVVKNRVCYSVMDVCYKLQKETKVFYDRLSKVSKKGLMLSDKLEEIQKVAKGRNNISAMKDIVNKNKEVMDRINVMMDNVHEIVDLVQKRLNELKAKGGCRKD